MISYPPPNLAPYALVAEVPTVATTEPSAIAVSPAIGGATMKYATADHVHPSKTRRERRQTAANGTLTWVYPTPFDSGVIPQIMAIAETAVGVSDVINVQVEGTPTNTQAVLRVTRTQISAVSLIGISVLSVPASPGVTWLNLSAFG